MRNIIETFGREDGRNQEEDDEHQGNAPEYKERLSGKSWAI